MNASSVLGAVAVSVVLSSSVGSADEFSSLWYDGNAEISTYRISESRYGEPREGVRVMVFVTEPLRLETYIKPDRKIPDEEKVRAIKLNDIRKFPTGIYDYSVMTSVFAAVEPRKGIPLMGTVKVSFTSQEWCGTVYERMLRREDSFEGVLYSYFESEGENEYSIPHEGAIEAEENLWIIVRELRGPVMKAGESRKMKILPSAWSRRKDHVPAAVVEAALTKGKQVRRKTALGDIAAQPFTWESGKGKASVWVETAYPRRILSWTEADGSVGAIIASRREPYWKQNKNAHLGLRDKLGLRGETGGDKWPF